MCKLRQIGFKNLMRLLAAAAYFTLTPACFAVSFEVWVVDQSDTAGQTFGGKIHIYDGSELEGAGADSVTPIETIDLGGNTAALCLQTTGALPVRPHMIFFNSDHRFAILSFVASGHVVIFDGASRLPIFAMRTSVGAGFARQAHAAFPSPDDTYILVANQNGKLLERIDTNYQTRTFTHNRAATLSLATCRTPNGNACEIAGIRPDNAPICPMVDSSGSLAFVTLRGGGLVVVDPRTNPITILAEYDRSTIHGNGCGGIEVAGGMYINSGGGTATNLSEFDVYRFPLEGYSSTNPPNTPAPTVLFTDDERDRDSHGSFTTKLGRYLWVLDRRMNNAEVFDVASGERVNTVNLLSGMSDDPSLDLADLSPSGNFVFVSLRGPNPLSGDPHSSTGVTPGVGVVQLEQGGRTGFMKTVVRISNRDANRVERADAHGIRVRLK